MTDPTERSWVKRWVIGDLSWKRVFTSFWTLLGVLYAYLLIYGAFFSEGKIFLPPVSSYQDSEQILKLTTMEGTRISALWLPNPTARHTLLYSHGNAEDLGDTRPLLDELRELGFSILAYDYPGYGTSQGHPSEQGTYQSIDAAYRYLTEDLQVPSGQIIGYGRSVGSGPTVDLASRQPIAGVILESPFVSAFRVLTRISIVPFDKFDNISKIQQIDAPLLILHGTEDTTIPIWHGQALYERALEPKFFLGIEGAGHNDLSLVGGRDYVNAIQEFSQQLTQR